MNTNEKIKGCLICGNDFTAERSTKKYCSDYCKQIAFYQRNSANCLSLNDSEKQSAEPTETRKKVTEEEIEQKKASFILSTFNTPTDTSLTIPKTNTTIYQPVQTTFIEAVAEAIEAEEQQMSLIMYPTDRWNTNIKEAITTINIRLLSLITNLLLLNRHNAIDRKTFLLIRNAFNDVVLSASFKILPREYSYSELIQELTAQCNSIAKMHKHTTSFRLRFSVKRKMQIMAIRFALASTVPLISFYEIQFEK